MDFDVDAFVKAGVIWDAVDVDVDGDVAARACPSDALLPCCCTSVSPCSFSSSSDSSPTLRSSASFNRSCESSGVEDLRRGDGFLGLPASDDDRETTGLRMGEKEAADGVSMDIAGGFLALMISMVAKYAG